MLSSRPDTAAQSQRKPPSPLSQPPQPRLHPLLSSEPLSLVSRAGPVTSASPGPRDKVSPPPSSRSVTDLQPASEPLSLVNKSPEAPENLSKRPLETDQRQMKSPPAPVRPEVGSIRVRPAEALSPLCQPPLKKARESPSPRLGPGTQRPPSSSPVPPVSSVSTSSASPRPPPASFPSFPPGFPSIPGLPPTSLPGLPPTSMPGLPPSPLASLYSPYSPYLSALSGHPAAPAPGPDSLWAAQAAQLMALGLPAGYPGYPGLHGYPPGLLPPSFPGAPAPSLPGLLPPHLLAPPPHSGPAAPSPATPPGGPPTRVGDFILKLKGQCNQLSHQLRISIYFLYYFYQLKYLST